MSERKKIFIFNSNFEHLLILCVLTSTTAFPHFTSRSVSHRDVSQNIHGHIDSLNLRPSVIPLDRFGDPIILKVNVNLDRLLAVKPAESYFEVVTTIIMNFNYSGMGWNLTQYPVGLVRRRADSIWLPKFRLENSLKKTLFQQKDDVILRAIPNNSNMSTVSMWIHESMTIYCNFKIKSFPFDESDCSILLFFNEYQDTEAVFYFDKNDYNWNNMDHPEWTATNITISTSILNIPYGEANLGYSLLNITIHLERNFAQYISSIVTPLATLVITSTFTFLLPSESGERIGLCVAVMLAYSLFQLLLYEELPKSKDTPRISLMITFCQIMSTLNLFITAINLKIFHFEDDEPFTGFKCSIFRGILRRICNQKNSSSVAARQCDKEPSGPDISIISRHQRNERSWRTVSHYIDRVMLLFNAMAYILASIIILMFY